MTGSFATERLTASKVRSWPPATIDGLRDSLFDAASGRLNLIERDSPDRGLMEPVVLGIAKGRLIDAGRLDPQIIKRNLVEARQALKAYEAPLPYKTVSIIFSVVSDGVERPELMVLQAEGRDGTTALFSLAALLDQDERVRLFQARNLTESVERQDAIENREIEICVVLRYLLACGSALTPTVHSSGIAYSRLDVEKAIRLKAADKAAAEPATSPDDGRPLTLGEARQALMDIVESPRAGVTNYVLEAAQQAKTGCLFVLENLPHEIVEARYDDAANAIGRGVLRAPFLFTAVLMKLERPLGACLLGIIDSGFVDDGPGGHGFSFWAVIPHWLPNGKVDWGRSVAEWTRFDPEEFDAAGSYDFDAPYVILSLIADSRSPVTRVEADNKLNKARVKRGKAPIPPYWRIEPPKPTVLVPGAAPQPATAKGGTHASPRPHDRRGHPRNLKSGHTVWVRDCKINALIPHLTCDRSFYEIRLKGIVPPSLDGEDAKQ